MSNKPKGFEIHPNNILNYVDIAYKAFICCAKNYARKHYGFSKHIGSKHPGNVKLMLKD